jgi:hypothetical protein
LSFQVLIVLAQISGAKRNSANAGVPEIWMRCSGPF